jgi:lysylphosphatidylglycerol synthase-like protein
MEGRVDHIVGRSSEFAGGLAGALAGVSVAWLVLAVVLHLANQVTRGCGWWAIVRAAAGGDLRRRDAVAAWIAGAGAAGLVTARLGDALRLLLVARRLPGTGASVVAGTLVAEGGGNLACGAILLAPLAIAAGVSVPVGPMLWPLALLLGLSAAAVAWRRRVRKPLSGRLAGILAGVRRGCAPLADVRFYALRVTPWQLASRVLRLLSVAAFLVAFHLPATAAAVLVVTLAEGGGRLVPFSPAAVGASAAMLTATFAAATGTAVSAAQLGALMIGMTALLTAIGVVAAAVIVLRAADWRAVPAFGRTPEPASQRTTP